MDPYSQTNNILPSILKRTSCACQKLLPSVKKRAGIKISDAIAYRIRVNVKGSMTLRTILIIGNIVPHIKTEIKHKKIPYDLFGIWRYADRKHNK